MSTPRRRRLLATGAFFFFACAVVVGGGCASRAKRPAETATPLLFPPRHVEIGRIHSYDATDATAVIEFVAQFRSTIPLAGTQLIARKLDTLEPTARLVAAPYQNNRTLGAYVTSGRPGVDDEVVIAPESALPAPAATP